MVTKMRLLLLNQYGPPDTPPTARLLGELANFLRSRGHEVEILAQHRTYGGRPASGKERLRRELAAAWFILRAGWQPRRLRPDVVLALSSPPGLLVVAALVAWRQRTRLAHWAMDLYPELAVALSEIPSGFLSGAVQWAMRWAYRRSRLVVALDEDMRDHLQPLCRVPVRVLPPWPPLATGRQLTGELDAASASATAGTDAAGWTWLYSGNLGRAHEWHTLLNAQRLLEDRGLLVRLVFQGDGAARPAAQARARELGLQRCDWLDYIPEDGLLASLLAARVLIVTQRPETRGLLWPSKLAVMERLPRPILYIGPMDGAIAARLRVRGNTGIFAPDQAEEVAGWVEEQFNRGAAVSTAGDDDQPASAAGCATMERWLAGMVDGTLS